MAIDRGIYSAPKGLESEVEVVLGPNGEAMEPDLEIEIVDPEMVTLDDGSVEITIIPDANIGDITEFDANLAEFLEEGDLNSLANDLIGYVTSDIDGRKEWADTFVRGLDVLGFKYEERTDPWDGACGVYSNVLAEAAIRFQAEAMSETFPPQAPVKVKVLGEKTRRNLRQLSALKLT